MSTKTINKVFLLGHLGQNPEKRVMPNGKSVVNVSLATKIKDGETEWHKLAFFAELADIAAQYLTKGSKVHIEGYLKNNKWEDQEGKSHISTQINVKDLTMLDSAKTATNQADAIIGV